MPAADASVVAIEAEQPADRVGHAERREQRRRVQAALVELSGRDAAGAARDLVGDGDGQQQVAAGDRRGARGLAADIRHRERGGHRRAAHVHDRLVVRVVELERLRQRGVGKGGGADAQRFPGAENPCAGPGGDSADAAARSTRPNGVPDPASARPMTSSIRSFVASIDVLGKVVVGQAGRPSRPVEALRCGRLM